MLQLSRLEDRQILVNAEKRLTAGDTKGAQELAQQALQKKVGDQGRALFILAEAALLGCGLFLTGDSHFAEMNLQMLAFVLRAANVSVPSIASPREIVRKFYR